MFQIRFTISPNLKSDLLTLKRPLSEIIIMNVKIDTKEKFHAITILEPVLYANMTEDIMQLFNKFMQSDVKNIVLNMNEVSMLEMGAAEAIVSAQQKAYENRSSFVVCAIKKDVAQMLEKEEMLDMLNVTPTESEAWDIVQMEEIERDLANFE
jgi:anti-anti-sigma regulatory factor